ncbi:MAG: DUF4352 domain-containing protein [Micropruina sp.]
MIVLLIVVPNLGKGSGETATPAAPATTSTKADSTKAPSQDTKAPKEEEKPQADSIPGVGKPVRVDDVILTLNSFKTTNRLSNGFSSKRGFWMSVDVTVANKGKDPIQINNSSFTLVEGDGTTYETDTDVLMFIDSDKSLFLKKINPKTTARGQLLFAIPKSAKDLVLVFKPGLFSGEAKVALAK